MTTESESGRAGESFASPVANRAPVGAGPEPAFRRIHVYDARDAAFAMRFAMAQRWTSLGPS